MELCILTVFQGAIIVVFSVWSTIQIGTITFLNSMLIIISFVMGLLVMLWGGVAGLNLFWLLY